MLIKHLGISPSWLQLLGVVHGGRVEEAVGAACLRFRPRLSFRLWSYCSAWAAGRLRLSGKVLRKVRELAFSQTILHAAARGLFGACYDTGGRRLLEAFNSGRCLHSWARICRYLRRTAYPATTNRYIMTSLQQSFSRTRNPL